MLSASAFKSSNDTSSPAIPSLVYTYPHISLKRFSTESLNHDSSTTMLPTKAIYASSEGVYPCSATYSNPISSKQVDWLQATQITKPSKVKNTEGEQPGLSVVCFRAWASEVIWIKFHPCEEQPFERELGELSHQKKGCLVWIHIGMGKKKHFISSRELNQGSMTKGYVKTSESKRAMLCWFGAKRKTKW